MSVEQLAGLLLIVVPIAFCREPDGIPRRFERDGGALAGAVVPVAYIAWSVWLIALGILMLI